MNLEIAEIDSWKEEISQLREKSKAYLKKKDLVAFYGSSSIRLWDQMSNDLAPHSTINLGFGGSSYFWCNHFFEEVFEFVSPSQVILYAGDNDLGSETPERDILNHVDQLLQKIQNQFGQIPISIISVKPSPDRLYLKNEIESLNEKLAEICRNIEHAGFINIYSAMLTAEGEVRPELYEEDQLHMKSSGYTIWKKVVKDHLDGSRQSIF